MKNLNSSKASIPRFTPAFESPLLDSDSRSLIEDLSTNHDSDLKLLNISTLSQPAGKQLPRTQQFDGYDILRLVQPSVEDFNVDFYCVICQSKLSYLFVTVTSSLSVEIVNQPLECPNTACGILCCTYCLNESKQCKQCFTIKNDFRRPSKIIQKMLDKQVIKCDFCQKAFAYNEIPQHESLCVKSWT